MRIFSSRLFQFVVFLVVAAAFWYLWLANWLADRRWAEHVKAARVEGEPWALAEYRPSRATAEESAKQDTVFSKIWELTVALKHRPKLVWDQNPKGERFPRIDWKTKRPLIAPPRKVSVELVDRQILEKVLKDQQPLVDVLSRSEGFVVKYSDDSWTAGQLPLEIALPRKGVEFLIYRTNLDLVLNRNIEAHRSLLAAIHLLQACREAPGFISIILKKEVVIPIVKAFREGLDAGIWSDDALRDFAREFYASNIIADVERGMKTERAYIREYLDRSMENPVEDFVSVFPQKFRFLRFVSRPDRAWFRDSQLWLDQHFSEVVDSYDSESQVWRPFFRKFDPTKLSEWQRGWKLKIAWVWVVSNPDYEECAVFAHAQVKMGAIASALELHRRANGEYPASLESLAPKYLPKLPVDPMTGRSFRYLSQPDGTYSLYSLGIDRVDQGGRIVPERGREVSNSDWPWWMRGQPN